MEEPNTVSRNVSDEISLLEVFRAVWQRRWLVLWITLGAATLGVGLSFVWPKTFEATATVFPISSSSSSSLSDYAGLAAMAGISLPTGNSGTNPSRTVSALLASRLLIERLVDDQNLLSRMESPGKTPDEARRNLIARLQKHLKSREDPKTGVIEVTFSLSDPSLARELTNRVLEILDQLLVEKSFTTNQKRREELNRQIEDQGKKLSDYQKQMADFQKQTALLNPTAQAGKAVDAYTSMIQQRMGLELQLATAQASYSSDNPRVTLLQAQLRNLEDQINQVKNQVNGDLPSLKMAPENMIRYQNLTRDLEIATKIYAGLLANLEQIKLASDKDQVYIEVLDKALLPEVGSPSRALVVALATMMGFSGSILIALLWYGLGRGKKSHESSSTDSGQQIADQ
jgi:uncharacterized protein involved in exopolysaccharide biosynthesis